MSSGEVSLPKRVIEAAKRLYSIFAGRKFPITSEAFASGLYYMNKYFHLTGINSREYALYAISALHLASKICENRIKLQMFVRVVCDARTHPMGENSALCSVLDELNGIPRIVTDEIVFIDELTQLLVNREMKIINALKWDFTVPKPYECAKNYIEKVLRWHLSTNMPHYEMTKRELSEICENFLNDLQYLDIFYRYKAEILAIVAIEMSFRRISLPLISPRDDREWWTYVTCAEIDQESMMNGRHEINAYFDNAFLSDAHLQRTVDRKSAVTDDEMREWIRFPVIPPKPVPLCAPPRFDLLDRLVANDDTFKCMDADHLPEFEPPDIRSPLYYEWKNELRAARQAKSKHEKEKKNKGEKDRKSSSSHSGKRDERSRNDSRYERDISPPRKRREHRCTGSDYSDDSSPRLSRRRGESPPHRRRRDESPPHRRRRDDSPPYRRRDESPPHRRRRDESPPHRRRDSEPHRRRDSHDDDWGRRESSARKEKRYEKR